MTLPQLPYTTLYTKFECLQEQTRISPKPNTQFLLNREQKLHHAASERRICLPRQAPRPTQASTAPTSPKEPSCRKPSPRLSQTPLPKGASQVLHRRQSSRHTGPFSTVARQPTTGTPETNAPQPAATRKPQHRLPPRWICSIQPTGS